MRFCVLGPVVAYGVDGDVELGPARQRTVLATLLVEPATAVNVDHSSAGDHGAAQQNWRAALTILDDIDHPEADSIRSKLAATEVSATGNGGTVTVAETEGH